MNKVWLLYSKKSTLMGIYDSEAAANQDAMWDNLIVERAVNKLRYCDDSFCDHLAMRTINYCQQHGRYDTERVGNV